MTIVPCGIAMSVKSLLLYLLFQQADLKYTYLITCLVEIYVLRKRRVKGFKIYLETRVTRRVKHELVTIPKHLSSPTDFSGVPVARSFVYCVGLCEL